MKLTKYSVTVKASPEEEPELWALYDALPSPAKRLFQDGAPFDQILSVWEWGPCPALEPFVYKDPFKAIHYAEKVKKGPFPLGEPAIATNAAYAFVYAKYCIKKPFPLGEPAIKKGEIFWSFYTKSFPQRANA